MSRIIKSNEVPGGYLQGNFKKLVANQNLNPTFDPKEKSWKLKKVLKTDTGVVPWLIEYDSKFYVAKQYFRHRMGETVSVFESNTKGKIDTTKPVYDATGYVDIETVVDLFVEKLSEEKLLEEISQEINEESKEVKE
jgi:hypothetical protein